MITTTNNFAGANFNYTNEGNCVATGDYRVEGENIVAINFSGQYEDLGRSYNFWGNRDAAGNVNISGVPISILTAVAAEVTRIIEEVEAIALPEPANGEEE